MATGEVDVSDVATIPIEFDDEEASGVLPANRARCWTQNARIGKPVVHDIVEAEHDRVLEFVIRHHCVGIERRLIEIWVRRRKRRLRIRCDRRAEQDQQNDGTVHCHLRDADGLMQTAG